MTELIDDIEAELNKKYLDYIEKETLGDNGISIKEAVFIKKRLRRATI